MSRSCTLDHKEYTSPTRNNILVRRDVSSADNFQPSQSPAITIEPIASIETALIMNTIREPVERQSQFIKFQPIVHAITADADVRNSSTQGRGFSFGCKNLRPVNFQSTKSTGDLKRMANCQSRKSLNIRHCDEGTTSNFSLESPPEMSTVSSTEYHVDYTSPHYPPISILTPPKPSIRESIIQNRGTSHYPDSFQNYMEERLFRWRPSSSNQGVDSAFNNRHPFQSMQESMGDQSEASILTLFKQWWARDQVNTQTLTVEDSGTPSPTEKILGPRLQRVLDLSKLAESFQNGNSSQSLVIARGSCSPHEPHLPTPMEPVTLQPGPTREFSYTPHAVPLSTFQLNFDKKQRSPGLPFATSVHDMEDEFQNLIDGPDNFLVGCLQITSICNC